MQKKKKQIEKEYVKVRKDDSIKWEVFRMRRDTIVKTYVRIRAKHILVNRFFKVMICNRVFKEQWEQFRYAKSKATIAKFLMIFWMKILRKRGAKGIEGVTQRKLYHAVNFQAGLLNCNCEHASSVIVQKIMMGYIDQNRF